MKYCHTIILTVFVKPEDIQLDKNINQKVQDCIKKMLVIDYDKEQVLKKIEAEGFENRKITIYELNIHKESHTNQFINNLMKNLTIEQKQFLVSDKHKRLDEELEFYLRLDKRELLEGRYLITDTGDCFHIKMTIAAFPKKRETALKVIDEMLKIN
jgi:RNA binding exosome subunit